MAAKEKKTRKIESKSPMLLGMTGCYALGSFADNFFKQCAVLLAAALGLTSIQSVATVLFSLPFILFSAWAGWLADRAAKKHIVVATKLTEFISLLLGAYFLASGSWVGILAVIFFMGMQSTAFSPALNGTIPEFFSSTEVPKVNSYIKMASTIAVLAGIALAGFFLDMRPGLLPDFNIESGEAFGRVAAGVFVSLISFLGLLTALSLKKIPLKADSKKSPFPWSGPKASIQHFLEYRKDPQFFLVLLAEGIFYAIVVIAVICVANLANELGYSATTASLLSACIMVGIAVGSIIAGRFDAYSWRRFLVPASVSMGIFLILISLTSKIPASPLLFIPDRQMAWFIASLFFAGVYGGIYLIPVASFIQVHPPTHEKGKAIAVSNFFSFIAITISGMIFFIVGKLPASWTFLVYGLTMVCFGLFFLLPCIRIFSSKSLSDNSKSIQGDFIKTIIGLRYDIWELGLDKIKALKAQKGKKEGILFLANHPALIDPLIVYSRIAGLRPRSFVDSRQVTGIKRIFARLMRMIVIPDISKDGRKAVLAVRQGLDEVVRSLDKGDSILLYPSGRLYQSPDEVVGANSAVEYILKERPETRVVLVRTKGLWGSSFSYACGKQPTLLRNILKKSIAVLLNGIFFVPKRGVSIEFVEPDDFPIGKDRKTINIYMEEFFKSASHPAFELPLFFWQGYKPRIIPCATRPYDKAKVLAEMDPELRRRIFMYISALCKHKLDINDDTSLGTDLGLDSMAIMELATIMEIEFGCSIFSYEGILTAGDCLLAASGKLPDGQSVAFMPPFEWFSPDTLATGEQIIYILPKENMIDAFLRQCRNDSDRLIMAEGAKVLSNRDVLAGSLLMAERFKKLPGERIGVLLPSSIASSVTWLALQIAGKVPVFLNWTLGSKNLESCIKAAGLERIIISTELWRKLKQDCSDLKNIESKLIYLETTMSFASRKDKGKCLLRARLFTLTGLGMKKLSKNVPETAVLLFSSGSSAEPKGVPLSHENIMSNMLDIAKMLELRTKHKVLAILPPFHSFGFFSGVAMPLCASLGAVYHNNPLEGHKLAGLIHHYGVSMMATVPSFLGPILKYGERTLSSLRLVFMGGEKCPEYIYQEFATNCPKAKLCEGYGLTECSSGVAVNPPERIKKGTVGLPLPSVELLIVRDNMQERADTGEQGHILIRGKSVFSGYLPEQGLEDPFVDFEGAKWFATEDLGKLDEDGYLEISGRTGRFIKIGGEMISLQQIEGILLEKLIEKKPDLKKNSLAVIAGPGTEEKGLPMLLALSSERYTLEDLNKIIKDAGLSPLYQLYQFIWIAEIPVLESGKTDYRNLESKIKSEKNPIQ